MIPNALAAILLMQLGQLFPSSQPSWEDLYYKRPEFAQGWKYIVIHHSATRAGSAQAFHRYHTQQGYGGLAYHFVIGNGNGSPDGKIDEGFRWKQAMSGTHSTVNAWYHNIFGIGICLVGDFSKTKPTAKQIAALDALVVKLATQYGIPPENILAHREVPWGEIRYDATSLTVDVIPGKREQTSCPGKNLSVETVRRRVAKVLQKAAR